MARNVTWCSLGLCDIFITSSRNDIAKYADENTPYASVRSIKEVVAFLEEVSEVTFQWFRDVIFYYALTSKCK